MTAVEWLIDKIKNDQNQKALSAKEWLEVFEQAKEMERKQILDAWDNGCEDDGIIDNAKQYYNETYGSKGSDECKICEGNGYTVEIDLDCCGNCNEDGSCCNIPKQVQVQMPCICSKINGNNVEKVPNVTSSQTEISDEEIEKEMLNRSDMWDDQLVFEIGWKDGIKWYREQLKKK